MSSMPSLIIDTASTKTKGAIAVADVSGDIILIEEITAMIKK